MTPAIHVYYVSNITQQQGFHTQEEIFHKSIVRSLKKRNQLFERACQNHSVAILHCVKWTQMTPRHSEKLSRRTSNQSQPCRTMADWMIVMVTSPTTCWTLCFIPSCFNQSHPPVAVCYPSYFCPDNVLYFKQEVCDLLAVLDVIKPGRYISQDARYTHRALLPHSCNCSICHWTQVSFHMIGKNPWLF